MSGLEYIMKRAVGANTVEASKELLPTNLEIATKQIQKYIESNLPKVIEVDFIPYCFDLSRDEDKIVMGGKHGNIAIFDLINLKTIKDVEICSCKITSVNLALDESLIIVTNQVLCLYIIRFPSIEIFQTVPLGPYKLDLRLGLNKDNFFVTNCTEFILFYGLTQIINEEDLYMKTINIGAPATCIDMSDDGSLIAFGLSDKRIKLFHGETETELQATDCFEDDISKICFSQHRCLLGVALKNNKVVVVNIGSVFSIKHTNNYHKGNITAMAFARDDRYLITGAKDSLIIMNDMKLERPPYFLELFDYKILCFRTSQNHQHVYYTQSTNKIMIWKVPILSKKARYRKHTKQVNSVLFIPGSSEIISIGQDCLAVIWDSRNDTFQDVLEFQDPLIKGIVSSTAQFAIMCTGKPSIIR